MKFYPKTGLFPWVSLMTGSVGLGLRCWLLSSTAASGLLPKYHIAGILSLLLLLATLAVNFWYVRQALYTKAFRLLFPPSQLAAAGSAIGAAGFGISAFTVEASGFLGILLPVLGILAAGAMLYASYCRLIGLRPNSLLHGALTVFLVFRILVCCREWGAEPQLQLYLFYLLGSLFLLLACYFRAEADTLVGDYRKYVYFGQAALFCCCLCLPGKDWLFYMSAGIWLATDYCVLPFRRHR